MSRRVSIPATSREIVSPAFTIVVSFFRTTLPFSIAAGKPACWSSPTIGPGLKLVVPRGDHDVLGRDLAAPRGGRRPRPDELADTAMNGFPSADETAVWSSTWSRSGRREGRSSAAAFSRACRSALLGATTIGWLALAQLAAHRLQRRGGDAPDADEGGHRLAPGAARRGRRRARSSREGPSPRPGIAFSLPEPDGPGPWSS